MKLKIEPEFPLRPEEQLPLSHFFICSISLCWFICTFSHPLYKMQILAQGKEVNLIIARNSGGRQNTTMCSS